MTIETADAEDRPVRKVPIVPGRPLEPHVVIIGGGFGGLTAARELRRARVRITLIDRRNHHLFQPLLYQVATAALSAPNIAQPIRSILSRQKNVRVLMGEVARIDVENEKVVLTDGLTIDYDYCIVATGATHAYFGHPEWEGVAPGLKTLEDAVAIRTRFLTAFEKAEREPDDDKRAALLTFVVVGAGPTGVEMAGAMAEMARLTLSSDFRSIDPSSARIILLEGTPRVLPTYPEDLSESARKQLERLGVEVRTSTMVTHIDQDGVSIGEERIPAHNVVWAAGVAASPLGKTLGVEVDRAGRVVVQADLSIPDHPEVMVIGDLAAVTDVTGRKVPGVAPAANQMAEHVVRNIKADMSGQARLGFKYKDKGSLATIGRGSAVGESGHMKFSGFIAWMAWLLIHVYFLIGFQNRLMVMWQWAWSYMTSQRGARLITHYHD